MIKNKLLDKYSMVYPATLNGQIAVAEDGTYHLYYRKEFRGSFLKFEGALQEARRLEND